MAGAVIVGVGPGIGQAVARRFAREGLPVALVARSAPTVHTLAEELGGLPLVADCTEQLALTTALDSAREKFGTPDVLVYNAAIIRADGLGELSVGEHQEAWAVNVIGAYLAASHTLPAMASRGHGTFIVTGGMPEPKPGYLSLSLGKAGARTLVDLLDQQFGPQGVHVATVTVSGAVASGTDFDPDDIAGHYWRLHAQPRNRWLKEIVH